MRCDSKTPVLLNTGVCVSLCPPLYTQSTEDATECVSFFTCPTGFSAAPGSNVQCNKPAPLVITEDETCAEGYQEWQRNLCYVDCPSPLTENGLSCFKPTLTRDSSSSFQLKTCGIFSVLNGTECKLTSIGIALFIVCGLGVAYLLYILYKHLRALVKESKRPIPVQDPILNKINAYFLSPALTKSN